MGIIHIICDRCRPHSDQAKGMRRRLATGGSMPLERRLTRRFFFYCSFFLFFACLPLNTVCRFSWHHDFNCLPPTPWSVALFFVVRLQTTSSALKGAIQLGIGYTVGNLSSKPERDVLMQDFYVVESIFFPRYIHISRCAYNFHEILLLILFLLSHFTPYSEGSNLTPAHHFPDFRFKTYAPVAFRYFRELFGIRPDDYLVRYLFSLMTHNALSVFKYHLNYSVTKLLFLYTWDEQ